MIERSKTQVGTGGMAGKKAKSGGLMDSLKTVAYALLIAVGIRTVFVEPFNIPSGSMIPTLLVGDYLFVSKWSYGYSRHSLPFSPPLPGGRLLGKVPERGDVVVFKTPADNRTDFIKRVVGLPGDKIQMQNGRLYINDQMVPREQYGEAVPTRNAYGQSQANTQYIETLPNGVRHLIIEKSDNEFADNTKVFVVPPEHLFMMGDNRDDSSDSRLDVGYVPFENLVGKAQFIFLSINGSFFAFWDWPWSVRFDRIGQGIH